MKKQSIRNCLNKLFTNGDVWMANKHMKRYSTSLVIREIQSKITLRCC